MYLATWRRDYNTERPHSSLDYRTPQEFDLFASDNQQLYGENSSYEWLRKWGHVTH